MFYTTTVQDHAFFFFFFLAQSPLNQAIRFGFIYLSCVTFSDLNKLVSTSGKFHLHRCPQSYHPVALNLFSALHWELPERLPAAATHHDGSSWRRRNKCRVKERQGWVWKPCGWRNYQDSWLDVDVRGRCPRWWITWMLVPSVEKGPTRTEQAWLARYTDTFRSSFPLSKTQPTSVVGESKPHC